jgi:ATP-dependent RNA helicase RhlE
MNFSELGISKLLVSNLDDEGYKTPTKIQLESIPLVLNGSDLLAKAQTGTGKTASFSLPMIDVLLKGTSIRSNNARALILAPTRELALQISEKISIYSKGTTIKSTVVYGGVKINPQMMKLRGGVDILVATPGRLLDLYGQNAVKFKDLEFLVLDEADRMLDMGFIHDIKKIISYLPRKRQNLMFSATFSEAIKSLGKSMCNSTPKYVSIEPDKPTVDKIKHWIVPVDKKRKSALLIKMIKEYKWNQTLVFMKTKASANKLVRVLDEHNIKSQAIHGNKSQSARNTALQEFKSKNIQVLVATDVAARGIDIENLEQVVNYDLPIVAEDYVHRIGRTGRAGKNGQAISFVSADEVKELSGIENLLQRILPREFFDGFEPRHEVPESKLKPHKKKIKKPKNPKVFSQEGKKRRAHSQKRNTLTDKDKPTGKSNIKR